MESFFLAETTKYLYLLFDEDNFLHNAGDDAHGELLDTEQNVCVVQAGAYIFNTEAHPMDMSALHCCHNAKDDIFTMLDLSAFTPRALAERSRKQRLAEQEKWKPQCQSSRPEHSYEAAGGASKTPPSTNYPSSSSNVPTPPTMAVDIEVFDEFQQPAADVLVSNFERIREERELNRTDQSSAIVRNQLTVTDLDDFFGQRREDFATAQEALSYVSSFMSNYTMDVAFIRGLQLFDGNISSVLGIAAQKEYESRMRSLWQLFELEQQFAVNVRLIRRLGLLKVEPESDSEMMRSYLTNILDTLDHFEQLQQQEDQPQLGSVNSTDVELIRNTIEAARLDYELAMLNTTAMQQFMHRVYLMGTNEAQLQQFQPLLSDEELGTLYVAVRQQQQQPPPVGAIEQRELELRELFKYTRRIVDFRKRMSETVDRLQTIMQDLKTVKTEPPTPRPVPMPPIANTATPTDAATTDTAEKQQQQQEQQQQEEPPSDDEGSVWSQLVQNILRKTTVKRIKFDEAVLLEKTRKSLEKHAHKQLSYELFSCRRPEYIEAFAYREFYPDAM